MKKLLILLLFPLMMFAQDTTLIGDVDCSGEVNSQDASFILQFVTNVIDSLPCEANMTGLTPEQLQEMIDMMDEQLTINYSGNIFFGDYAQLYPGSLGFTGPGGNLGLTSDTIQADEDGFLFAYYTGGNSNSNGGTYIYVDSTMLFNNSIIHGSSFGSASSSIHSFCVPIKKDYYYKILLAGTMINKIYWVPLQSGESTTTTNSVAETGGSPIFIDPIEVYSGNFQDPDNYPYVINSVSVNIDSLIGENIDAIIIHSNFTASVNYSGGLNISINSWNGEFLTPVFDLYSDNNGSATYNNNEITRVNNQVVLPNNNDTGIIELLTTQGSYSTGSPSGSIKIVGYFSSAGSGSNSAATTSSVSTFGDTLFVGNESYIIPGISYNNVVPEFGSVTDIDGNTYQTVFIYGKEWMMEDLKVTTFSNGDPIDIGACDTPSYLQYDFGNLGIKLVYNAYAVYDERNICPEGWHIPTLEEYSELINNFATMTPNGTFYGQYWPNGAPFFKNPNGEWNTTDYFPFGSATNQSYISFNNYSMNGCSGPVTGQNNGLFIWTSSPASNGEYFELELFPNLDIINVSTTSLESNRVCRCVKD